MTPRLVRTLGIFAAPLLLAGCGGGQDATAADSAQDETAAPAETASEAEASVNEAAAPATKDAAAAEETASTGEAAPEPLAAAPAEPPAAFAVCRACHSVEPGKNGVGPSLFGVFGRKAASVDGFNYSPAMRASGLTWDRATLDEYTSAPMKKVPGARMVLAVPDAERRKAIIDYLETLK